MKCKFAFGVPRVEVPPVRNRLHRLHRGAKKLRRDHRAIQPRSPAGFELADHLQWPQIRRRDVPEPASVLLPLFCVPQAQEYRSGTERFRIAPSSRQKRTRLRSPGAPDVYRGTPVCASSCKHEAEVQLRAGLRDAGLPPNTLVGTWLHQQGRAGVRLGVLFSEALRMSPRNRAS